MNVRVSAKERVQPGLEPIAVAIAPRRELAARDMTLLENERRLTGIGEIFGGGETRGARADD